eukprot:366014-Chlamydomonas_euryale.AAC.4
MLYTHIFPHLCTSTSPPMQACARTATPTSASRCHRCAASHFCALARRSCAPRSMDRGCALCGR